MNGEDWTSYEFQPAPSMLLCQFRRRDGLFQFSHTGFAKDFLPEFNVAGLEWNLTGIAREQLERMSPEARAQVMSQTGMYSWLAKMTMQAAAGQASISQRDAAYSGVFSRENASILLDL